MTDRDRDKGMPASEADDLSARLRAHTRALQQNVRALQETIAAVDAAVAVSRARLFVRHRPPAGLAERRAGFDRRRQDDPVSALVRWVDGDALERRAGEDRRTTVAGAHDDPNVAPGHDYPNVVGGEGRHTVAGAAAPEAAPEAASGSPSATIVSLDAFRARRASLRPRG